MLKLRALNISPSFHKPLSPSYCLDRGPYVFEQCTYHQRHQTQRLWTHDRPWRGLNDPNQNPSTLVCFRLKRCVLYSLSLYIYNISIPSIFLTIIFSIFFCLIGSFFLGSSVTTYTPACTAYMTWLPMWAQPRCEFFLATFFSHLLILASAP